MTICYFGTYNKHDPRNRVLLGAFKDLGIEVLECNTTERGLKKYLDLARKLRALRGRYEILFVAFPGYTTAILAKLLSHRRRMILDAYISYYDTLLDRKRYPRYHPRLLMGLFLDTLSTFLADEVLTINSAYRKFFIEKIKVSPAKIHVIRKGADQSLFYPRNEIENSHVSAGSFVVGWYGSFIPLHGVEYIIEAARVLKNESEIEFWLIGTGQTYERMRSMASEHQLDAVKFLGRYPYEELPKMIQRMDVVLGIFSPNEKAMRCVTNKVYEAIAMGKAVITEDSPANQEIFTHRRDVYLCEPGSGQALADAILEMKNNPDLKKTLEIHSYQLFRDRFSRKHIAADLLRVIHHHV